jgi:hypothetical protein
MTNYRSLIESYENCNCRCNESEAPRHLGSLGPSSHQPSHQPSHEPSHEPSHQPIFSPAQKVETSNAPVSSFTIPIYNGYFDTDAANPQDNSNLEFYNN